MQVAKQIAFPFVVSILIFAALPGVSASRGMAAAQTSGGKSGGGIQIQGSGTRPE
jgi:hypothetical protein